MEDPHQQGGIARSQTRARYPHPVDTHSGPRARRRTVTSAAGFQGLGATGTSLESSIRSGGSFHHPCRKTVGSSRYSRKRNDGAIRQNGLESGPEEASWEVYGTTRYPGAVVVDAF